MHPQFFHQLALAGDAVQMPIKRMRSSNSGSIDGRSVSL
jgi:hypothetical protein